MSRRWLGVLGIVAVIGLAIWLRPKSEAPHEASSPKRPWAETGHSPSPRPPPPRGQGRLSLPEAGAAVADELTHGAIAGVVRDWESDAPVVGAELTFLDETGAHAVLSDAAGRFVFVAPTEGGYALTSVLADGYQPYVPELGESGVHFTARSGRRVEGVKVYLVPRLELEGEVVTVDGAGAGGADIRVLAIGIGESALADGDARYVADASGRFRLAVGLGAWLEARHPEHGVGRAEVDERALVSRTLTIVVDGESHTAGESIGGTVLGPEGAPLPDARVVATASTVPRGEATTDEEGRFTIRDLVAGTYRIEASHGQHAPVWAPAIPTGTTELRLQLAAGGSIEGTLRGDDGLPIAGATVVALRHSGGLLRVQQARVTVFDAEGSYRLGGLPPGLYDVVGAAHGRGMDRVLDVGVGTVPASVDLRLPSGVQITGRVVDESSSRPIVAARVELERHVGRGTSIAPMFATATSDHDGAFVLRGIEPGRHSITAYARDHVARTLSGIEVEDADVGPVEMALAPDEGQGWGFDIVGIGVSISASATELEVVQVVTGGGAEKAGVLPADRIVAVDGIPVEHYDFGGAVEALRGIEGTQVRLDVVRGDARLDLTATRSRVRG